MSLGDFEIVLTTDPAPDPAAKVIGGDGDLYWMGRLLVTINASDLGAAGARPLAFLSAIECQPDMLVEDFERLLSGIKDACSTEGLEYVGGNLKESSKLTATGMAVGYCTRGSALHRSGARNGDILLSVGPGGIFWRDALMLRRGRAVADKTASPVFQPVSQVRNMALLASRVPISVAMDNSDGLLATAEQLASTNGMSVIIDLDQLTVPNADALEIDQARLWLGWGDWNVLVGVSADAVPAVVETADNHGFAVKVIGQFKTGVARALVRRSSVLREAPRLESERFAADSWFATGIDGYVKLLLEINLP